MTASMDMYFLDVGQGDCTYLEVGTNGTKDQKLYLIDFGFKEREFIGHNPAYQSRIILVERITIVSKERKLQPFVDHLFITHPDSDHWNMVYSLITGAESDGSNLWEKQGWPKGTQLKVGTLTFGGEAKEYSNKSGARHLIWWATIIDAATTVTKLENKDHDKQDSTTGAVTRRWPKLDGGDLNIYLINSNFPQKAGGATNPKSLCLIFEFKGFKLMLLGDAEPTDIKWQLEKWYPYNNHAFLQCDVLKLAHHGSRKGTPKGWPEMVKPKYAFVSGDCFWAHPYQEALENVFEAKTLNARFFKHWVSSFDDSVKDYKPYQTETAMFSNLWYVVTSAQPVKAKNQEGIELTYPNGQYVGVAWILQKFEGKDAPFVNFSPEDVWPGVGQVPKVDKGPK
jgi:beta-lactamase superfamily II metal-dependent hydrolase